MECTSGSALAFPDHARGHSRGTPVSRLECVFFITTQFHWLKLCQVTHNQLMAMQQHTIPRTAEIEYGRHTPQAYRELVTHPIPRFYTQYPRLVKPLFRKGIQIGADYSIIKDYDIVMNRKTFTIDQIDHVHGCHRLYYTSVGTRGRQRIEKVRIPIAQMRHSKDQWFAHDMILIKTWPIDAMPFLYYKGLFLKAILRIQRTWRRFRKAILTLQRIWRNRTQTKARLLA